jgi:hypothetical protein
MIDNRICIILKVQAIIIDHLYLKWLNLQLIVLVEVTVNFNQLRVAKVIKSNFVVSLDERKEDLVVEIDWWFSDEVDVLLEAFRSKDLFFVIEDVGKS